MLFLAALVVSLLITFPVLWGLNTFKLFQVIRPEGPRSHIEKSHTPTMAGIGFVLSIIILCLVFINYDFDPQYLALIFLILGFAAIGLTDDLLKVLRQQNLGLNFWQKIILQTVLASVFSLFLLWLGHNQDVGGFLMLIGFSNPFLYFLLSVFMIVGTANATNLTDGLNGLLAGTAGIAFLAFALLSLKLGIYEASSFCLIASGAVFAFLYFNFPKARAFMGDVGSLSIGAALAGIAIIIHQELVLIIIGAVFVAEALSVILQVIAFKFFKKRIFKMSPLHHHFELMGYSETKIVIGFWIVAAILGLIGVFL